MIRLSKEYFSILYDYLHKRLYEYSVIQADEIIVLVNKNGRVAGGKSWQMIDTIHEAKSSANIYSIAKITKTNHLKPYSYFEYLLTEIPKHIEDANRDFLENLLPWSKTLPAYIRKTEKTE